MKKNYLFIIVLFAIFIASCSQKRMLTTRLSNEWNIAKFESRSADGQISTIENAGTIVLNQNGSGQQTFTAMLTQATNASESQFTWENTTQTVSIKTSDANPRKVWIIVESGRTSQKWYSTDSQGNVQVMELKRK